MQFAAGEAGPPYRRAIGEETPPSLTAAIVALLYNSDLSDLTEVISEVTELVRQIANLF